MTTMIERLLARMLASREELEAKLDRGANADVGPSAFATIGADSSVSALMAAAAADNSAKAAARLRALHEPATQREVAPDPVGAPRTLKTIDAEFLEIDVEKKSDGNT